MLSWVWNSWFLISEKLIIVGLAFMSFYWFQPPLAEVKEFAFGWIAEMYLRNLVLMTGVAGGLHLYFYSFTKQGQTLKYDPRPLMKNGKQFTLGGQIRDNMFWTLASGVTADLGGPSGMVCRAVSADPNLGKFLLLLDPSAASYPIHVQICACFASSKY